MRFSPEIERVRSISDFIKAHFRQHWREQFELSIASGFQHDPERYLHLIEFEVPGADDDELWASFETAYRELGPSNGRRHVGLGYIAQSHKPAGTILRALVLVHPAMMRSFTEAAARTGAGGSSQLSISRCDFDHGDPDATYRWFAEGISREVLNPARPNLDGMPVFLTDWISPAASQVEMLSPV